MKKIFTFGIMILLAVSLAFAAIPGIPHQFYGEVTVNGAPAADGISVVAKIDGSAVEEGTTKDGKFGFDSLFKIEDPNNDRVGETITFYVKGVNTGETEMFIAGGSTNLDLSVTVSTTTTTTSGGSSGGGGGGGGGGSSSYDDTTDWTCEWSECVDGEQSATCTHNTRTGVSKKMTQACDNEVEEETLTAETTTNENSGVCVEDWKCNYWSKCDAGSASCTGGWVDQNDCGTQENLPSDDYVLDCIPQLGDSTEEAETKTSFFSGITGAVAGVFGSSSWIYLLILVIVIAVLVGLFVAKKKGGKKPVAKKKAKKKTSKKKKARK